MNEELLKAWLAERGISLEQGFAESLHEYALEYKKKECQSCTDLCRAWMYEDGYFPMETESLYLSFCLLESQAHCTAKCYRSLWIERRGAAVIGHQGGNLLKEYRGG